MIDKSPKSEKFIRKHWSKVAKALTCLIAIFWTPPGFSNRIKSFLSSTVIMVAFNYLYYYLGWTETVEDLVGASVIGVILLGAMMIWSVKHFNADTPP